MEGIPDNYEKTKLVLEPCRGSKDLAKKISQQINIKIKNSEKEKGKVVKTMTHDW